MKLYQFNTTTGEYLTSFDAKVDKPESDFTGKLVFIEYMDTTQAPPPDVKDNQCAVYKDGQWTVIPDYRGQVYHTDSDHTSRIITILGRLPDTMLLGEYVKTPEEVTYDTKMSLINTINNEYTTAVSNGVTVTVDGTIYHMDCDATDYTSLKSGIDLATVYGDTTIDITDYNNIVHQGIKLTDAVTINNEQFKYFMALKNKKSLLRSQVLQGDLTVTWSLT